MSLTRNRSFDGFAPEIGINLITYKVDIKEGSFYFPFRVIRLPMAPDMRDIISTTDSSTICFVFVF